MATASADAPAFASPQPLPQKSPLNAAKSEPRLSQGAAKGTTDIDTLIGGDPGASAEDAETRILNDIEVMNAEAVTPQRLIIAPEQNADTIAVSNKSDRERRYDLSLIDQNMTENGVTMRTKNDSFEYSVKKMVGYTPRRFTLKPGESQVVRVVVNRSADLADGDYHSYLHFREVPLTRQDKERLQEARAMAKRAVSLEIRTPYGIAVPIVVQQGKIASDIGIDDVTLGGAKGIKRVSIRFVRSGNAEASGKLSAEYVKGNGKGFTVIEPQWIRIYRETGRITKEFDLANLPSGAHGGKLVIRLIRDEADPSKTITREIALN